MNNCDVAVVGAGVFGAWTAWWLRRAGKSVLLLDAWGPGHARSSSGGETRVIRMGYGPDQIYTRMAMRSLGLWQKLFRKSGQPLFHETGVLWMTREGDAYGKSTIDTLGEVGVLFEVVPNSELVRRYPQMRLADSNVFGVFEPKSGALMARRAVATVVDAALRMGVEYRTAAIRFEGEDRPEVRTSTGDLIQAHDLVFACGPWMPKVFPDVLGERIFPSRQEVFFFAPPVGAVEFAPPHLPVWIDFSDPRGPYGFPDIEARGVKLAFDRHGTAFDPDSADRVVSEQSVEEAREFLSERFPALTGAPLAEARVCQYENTSTGDFLIDRHPRFENVWLVGGGSGHGFKHGPAVGEYACAQILGTGSAEPRFSLASKGVLQQRTVF